MGKADRPAGLELPDRRLLQHQPFPIFQGHHPALHPDTVVLITHDNSIAVKAKRIVRLQDGRIIYDGDAHDPKAVVQPELDEEVGAL